MTIRNLIACIDAFRTIDAVLEITFCPSLFHVPLSYNRKMKYQVENILMYERKF